MWLQKEITLTKRKRGFHLITDEIEQVLFSIHNLNNIHVGLLSIFIKHSSASLTINENADPTVRVDMESHFNHFVPERAKYYLHTYEGDDDMPAHIKTSILGCNVTVPISNGQLNMGMWQGIYLGEHRDNADSRSLVLTISGE